MFCQPFLFGTVGAAVLFSKIEPSQIGKGLVVIFIGVSARWLATFMVTCEKKYNAKERAFMAFAWIPKATVQAALGGLTLAEAQKRDLPEWEEYGQAMLTTAVFAIIITAPLGAIMINTLGTKWLEYDGDDPVELQKNGMVEPRKGWVHHGRPNFVDHPDDDEEEPSQDKGTADREQSANTTKKTNTVVPATE